MIWFLRVEEGVAEQDPGKVSFKIERDGEREIESERKSEINMNRKVINIHIMISTE